MQGSGTFAVEAMLGSLVPKAGAAVVLSNGAYGERMLQILQTIGRPGIALRFSQTEPVQPEALERLLRERPEISHVVCVHCETTTGLLNPIESIAQVTRAAHRALLIDAMSALGALDMGDHQATAVAASSNKCLEGAPGVGYVVVDKSALVPGVCHSLSLDLCAQHQRFEQDGQWRFTPPTHVMAALDRALALHEAEDGQKGRYARYAQNCRALVEGMRSRGFRPLLPEAVQAPIIVTFEAPKDPRFVFERFYDELADRGFKIYPGKLTERPSFRVGCIGQVYPDDMDRFLSAVDEVQAALGFKVSI